jgi:hypothetical protein
MTIRTPKYIKMIEKKTETVLSVLSINDVTIEKEKLEKMLLVFVNQVYPDGGNKELIYKTQIPFYLYLKQSGVDNHYRVECYFNPDNINAVKIFLNSLLKKKN